MEGTVKEDEVEFQVYSDLCLFCRTNLLPNWREVTFLESQDNPHFSIRLDDKEKNCESFEFICDLFGVRFENNLGIRRLDKGKSLPLCSQCQFIFQEAYQLQVQIVQLGNLIKRRVKLITEKIRESEEKISLGGEVKASYELFGLQQLREHALSLSNPDIPSSLNSPLEPSILIKTELEEGELERIEDWNEDDNLVDSFIDENEDLPSILPPKRSRMEASSSSRSNKKQMNLEESENSEDSFHEDAASSSEESTKARKKQKSRRSRKKTEKPFYKTAIPPGEKDYSMTCHLCDETFPTRKDFLTHYEEIHPEERKYSCKICKQHFSELRDCQTHQWGHTGERPFKCCYCPNTFNRKKSRNDHQKWYHEMVGPRFACTSCSKTFPNQSMLKQHQSVHNETVVVCKSCGVFLKSEESFKKHNKKCHGGTAECSEPIEAPKGEEALALVEGLGVQLKDTRPMCHICWKPIVGQEGRVVQRHFEEVHGGANPLQCGICGKICREYTDTKRHAYRHLGEKKEMCDKCDKRFVSKNELRNHSKTHLEEGEKPKFVCDICGVVYSTKGNLVQHRKMFHEGEGGQKWVCEVCGKAYLYRKGYVHHKKSVHLGETPFKCKDCGKGFVGRSELEKHARMHSGLKPFECSKCDKKFGFRHGLDRHLREVHEGVKGRHRRKKEGGGEAPSGSNVTTSTFLI